MGTRVLPLLLLSLLAVVYARTASGADSSIKINEAQAAANEVEVAEAEARVAMKSRNANMLMSKTLDKAEANFLALRSKSHTRRTKLRAEDEISYFDFDTFEQEESESGLGDGGSQDMWIQVDDTDVPERDCTTAYHGSCSLKLSQPIAVNFQQSGDDKGEQNGKTWDVDTYPYLCTGYKFPNGETRATLLIKLGSGSPLGEGWRSIEFTELPASSYKYSKVASFGPVLGDASWHYKCIDLQTQLGDGTVINELMFGSPDSDNQDEALGEMWIDNWSITNSPLDTVYYDLDTFEETSDGIGGGEDEDVWEERNGVKPVVKCGTTSYSGKCALYFEKSFGRNFEILEGLEDGQLKTGYLTDNFPYMCMAYKIPEKSTVNMVVLVDGDWKSITLTSDVTSKYGEVASWGPILNDDQWHYKCIDLKTQIGSDKRISAVAFHTGGHSEKDVSGSFWIDDFSITSNSLSTVYYDLDTFETTEDGYGGGGDADTWAEFNDATPSVECTETAYSGSCSLKVTEGGALNFDADTNLEDGQVTTGYNLDDYPYMCMAYKLESGSSNANMVAEITDGNGKTSYKSISLTAPASCQQYDYMAKFENVEADGEWHYDCVDVGAGASSEVGASAQVTKVFWGGLAGGCKQTGEMYIDEFGILDSVDCQGSWSDYSECSAVECGEEGEEVRRFTVKIPARNGGAECEAEDGEEDRRFCSADECVLPRVYLKEVRDVSEAGYSFVYQVKAGVKPDGSVTPGSDIYYLTTDADAATPSPTDVRQGTNAVQGGVRCSGIIAFEENDQTYERTISCSLTEGASYKVWLAIDSDGDGGDQSLGVPSNRDVEVVPEEEAEVEDTGACYTLIRSGSEQYNGVWNRVSEYEWEHIKPDNSTVRLRRANFEDEIVFWKMVNYPEETSVAACTNPASFPDGIDTDTCWSGDDYMSWKWATFLDICNDSPIEVKNYDFEEDSIDLVKGYTFLEPTSWEGDSESLAVIKNGNKQYGGISSGHGDYFLAMTSKDTTIEQTIDGLVPEVNYELTFIAANRPENGGSETLRVWLDDEVVMEDYHPGDEFTHYKVSFEAEDTITTVKFENSSPNSDDAIFIDAIAITVSEDQDQGEGEIELDEEEEDAEDAAEEAAADAAEEAAAESKEVEEAAIDIVEEEADEEEAEEEEEVAQEDEASDVDTKSKAPIDVQSSKTQEVVEGK